jgi:galactonate dehydratase
VERVTRDERSFAVKTVEAVRSAVGNDVEIMIEGHGRFNVETAVEVARLLEPYHPAWFEEPVASDRIDLLATIKARVVLRVAAGERLYTLPEFQQLISKRGADIIQMDVAHCGGILASKKIAAFAAAHDLDVSPHCSIGPVALSAALHFDVSTPNFRIQEDFGGFDVPWRSALVRGWNPIREGYFYLTDQPGLGLDINEVEILAHPYVKNAFPSLWDKRWQEEFTQVDLPDRVS